MITQGNLEWADQNHDKRGAQHSYNDFASIFGVSYDTIRGLLRRYRKETRGKDRPYPVPPNVESDGQFRREVSPNTITLETQATIMSLDEVLAMAKVDRSVWRVDHHTLNPYQMGAKDRHSDLILDKGKVTGTVKEDGIVVTQMCSYKIWLIRINPIPVLPHVKPFQVTAIPYVPSIATTTSMQRALILADQHIGFKRDLQTGELYPLHDLRTFSLAFQIAADAKPDRIDILGDLLDNTEWTDRFARGPEFAQTTQPAVLVGHWFLRRLREICPDAEIDLHQGNHEGRLDKALLVHLKAACELKAADEMELPPALSVQKLLALHKIGVGWIGDYPDDLFWLNNEWRLRHGMKYGPNAARDIAARADVTEVAGHAHRRQSYARTIQYRDGPRIVEAFVIACMCHIDHRVPGHKFDQPWQQSVGLIDYDAGGSMGHLDPIPINEGVSIWNGQLYQAEDLLPDLRAMYPDWPWVA